ncbi:uncharacterized protein [Spinacia oleracea]|uniref:Uncharacterized protein isoform X1 n=1 Tax=Spinacia oleracea TaxID=3562 RepID=A0ABM3RVQ9_SPIOL|nr:uncharacterized protein LOC110792641 isoform X1 [Spinacia oleracea]
MIKVTQWSKVRLRSSSCANDSYYWSWLFIMEISRRGIIYYGNPVIEVRLRSSSCANDSYYWSWLFIMEISRRGIIYYGNPVIEVPGLITPNSAANDQLSMVYYRYLRSRKVGTLHVAKASAGCEVVNSTHLPLKRSLVLCLHGS